METALFIWAASSLPVLAKAIGLAGVVILPIYAFLGFLCLLDSATVKLKKWPLVLAFSLILISKCIPEERTMYMMAAGYVAQNVVQSETGDKIVKIVNRKLAKYIEDLAAEPVNQGADNVQR